MKKLLITVLIILISFVFIFYLLKNIDTEKVNNNKLYRNNYFGISFYYPPNLNITSNNKEISINHSIPFQNSGSCNMMGDLKSYDKLTDFNLTIEIKDKNLVETIKENSPYIPRENFINDKIIVSPGFIDEYEISNFKGFKIYEGAEGCGETVYYLKIDDNKTLILKNEEIQNLNPSISDSQKINEILKIPDVISQEKSKEIFIEIMNSLKIK